MEIEMKPYLNLIKMLLMQKKMYTGKMLWKDGLQAINQNK